MNLGLEFATQAKAAKPRPAPVVMHLISSLRIGGAERMLISLLSAARAAPGARYVVCIMNDEIDGRMLAELEACGWPCHRLGRREGHRHPGYVLQLAGLVRRYGVDVVHAHNEGSRKWAMLLRLVRPGLQVVYTLHCQGLAQQYGAVARWLYRAAVGATVAISPATADEGAQIGAPRLTHIPNGVDLSRFRGVGRRREASGPLRILQVGRFAQDKGQDILIRAVALCRAAGLETSCVVAGVAVRPDDPWLEHLHGLVRDLGVEDVVRIVQDRLDVEALLAEADVSVLPSRAEGFGLALVEAMAAGVPVIAARVGGPARLIDDGVNGLLVPAEDPAALAGALMRVAGDGSLRRSLAAEGLCAAERYDIARAASAHALLYADLAG
ncbi:glycosyltransferase [Alsobacter sp. SYSU BS001988]